MAARQKKVSALTIFFRLTRVQFLPLIVLPALCGTFLAYRYYRSFNPMYFALMLAGVVLLHLGANAIDDCYDHQNGVDAIANSTFPKDFGGWKPLPRGLISLSNAKLISYALLLGSLLLAAYFGLVVGPLAFILGGSGVILAIAYTAPPLKLDYRGLGLGEIAIFLAFGPIPVLGSFYIQTGILSLRDLLVSFPIGLMTVTILIDHDLIFYEVYSISKKFSLATILGRRRALLTSLALTFVSYVIVMILAVGKVLPITSCLAPLLSGLILARKSKIFGEAGQAPPYYVPFTTNALLSNWIFCLVLALTILI